MALGVANNVLKVCEMKASGEFKEFLIRRRKNMYCEHFCVIVDSFIIDVIA